MSNIYYTQEFGRDKRGRKPVNINTSAFLLNRNAVYDINMGGDFTRYIYVWEGVQSERTSSPSMPYSSELDR